MLTHYRVMFTQVRKYPGMFGVRTYREAVAFVDGCDAATQGMLLEGLHEWLQMRLGQRTTYGWSAIVLYLTFPSGDEFSPRQLAESDEAAALERAFDLLDEFLAIREQRGGLGRIYVEFHRWHRAQADAPRETAPRGPNGDDLPAAAPDHPTVWIFHGDGARFASGVFGDRDTGLAWIARHALTGILTEYRVGDGCYDLAVRAGRFRPSKPHHGQPGHVAGFSPSGEHIHVANGHHG